MPQHIEPAVHQAIMELYARYCQTADADQSEAWADCFTPDGELRADGEVLGRGRDQLVARRAAGRLSGTRQHWNGNIILSAEADGHVTGTAYLMVVDIDVKSGVPSVTLVGNYRDDVHLTADGWKFSRREVRFLARGASLLPST